MSAAPKRVVVVGAGLAGLATAIRLAAEGVHVTVVERGTRPGGKKAIVKLAEGQSIPIFEGVA